jgi:hypothetical protein
MEKDTLRMQFLSGVISQKANIKLLLIKKLRMLKKHL